MAILRRNGHDLYYEEHGTGAPIVGVHGSPSSAAFWEDAAPELARLGRCILYDRRGYFRSGWGEVPATLDLDDQLDDLAALLTELDAAPAIVIGRSTGGLIAVALAVRHPELVRALVLLEPAVFALVPEVQQWADELRATVLVASAEDPTAAARAVFDHALGPELWESLSEEAREIFSGGSTATLAEIRGRGLDLSEEPFAPTEDELAGVGQPTLVVSGDESYPGAQVVDDRLTAALPDARHEVVSGGHMIHPAHPAVLAFLAELLDVGRATADERGVR